MAGSIGKDINDFVQTVVAVPVSKMRCAVDIAGKLRLIPLNRKPTSTPSSRSSESSAFSLVDIPIAGATTLGSVQLVMGLQEGTDWDEYLRQQVGAGGTVKLDFRILGEQRVICPGRVQVKAKAAAAKNQAGLSEVVYTPAGGGDASWKIGDTVRRGSVIELDAAADNAGGNASAEHKAAVDLTVISHLLYGNAAGTNPKAYAKGTDREGASRDADTESLGPFAIRDQSVKWIYEGKALSYNDQFDEELGLCALEISQSRAVANREIIRSDDVNDGNPLHN